MVRACLLVLGLVETFAGKTNGFADGMGTFAKFERVIGLTIDSNGVIFVSDGERNVIRKISTSG